ncbi:MAG: DUF6677 family protein [Phycisphaerales bacterium]
MPTNPPPFLDDPPFQPVAAVAALAFPGAGHAYLGETRRAILIAAGVLGLFFGGIFIGGVDVVDRKEDFVWFLGQGLVGPVAFGVDYYHQNHLKVRLPTGARRSAEPYEIREPGTGIPIVTHDPDTGQPVQLVHPVTRQPLLNPDGSPRLGTPADRPPNSKSVGRVNELGTLMSAVAGMLNLVCIVDASSRRRVQRPRRSAP